MEEFVTHGNFWLKKRQEQRLVQVLKWAQSRGIKVETLSAEDIQTALETDPREIEHANKSR